MIPAAQLTVPCTMLILYHLHTFTPKPSNKRNIITAALLYVPCTMLPINTYPLHPPQKPTNSKMITAALLTAPCKMLQPYHLLSSQPSPQSNNRNFITAALLIVPCTMSPNITPLFTPPHQITEKCSLLHCLLFHAKCFPQTPSLFTPHPTN